MSSQSEQRHTASRVMATTEFEGNHLIGQKKNETWEMHAIVQTLTIHIIKNYVKNYYQQVKMSVFLFVKYFPTFYVLL